MISQLWDHLPKRLGVEAVSNDVSVDARKLLPVSRSYFTYQGSLTTPPCSEGVRWFVLKTPADISNGPIAEFGQLYPGNARPVQAVNGRQILVTSE